MAFLQLDHHIVHAHDVEKTAAFWEDVLGLKNEGASGPFTTLRVSPELVFLLSEWKTDGGQHYAFAVNATDFDAIFTRVKNVGIPYGGEYDTVGSQSGPGMAEGARGPAKTLYFHDPNRHLLEVRCYAA